MRIAAFNDGHLGVVSRDETVVDVTSLLQPFEPIEVAHLLPDLIAHFKKLRPEFSGALPVDLEPVEGWIADNWTSHEGLTM